MKNNRFPNLQPGDLVSVRWAGTDLPAELLPFSSYHPDGLHVYVKTPNGTAYAILDRPTVNPKGKPSRFDPLKPATGSAGEIVVVCLATRKRAQWNDAARAGWVADLNGEAFRAYYSPEGRAKVAT